MPFLNAPRHSGFAVLAWVARNPIRRGLERCCANARSGTDMLAAQRAMSACLREVFIAFSLGLCRPQILHPVVDGSLDVIRVAVALVRRLRLLLILGFVAALR